MQTILQSDPIIQQLLHWAASRDAVRALLLTSSRATPHAVVDILSDYDVILVVRDLHPFYTDRSWLQHFGQVLVSYWDPIHPDPTTGLARVGNVIQFVDNFRIDFTLWPVALAQAMAAAPTLPDELDAGYSILLDKDHLLDDMAPPTYRAYIPTPPTNQAFQTLIEEFFSDAPHLAKCLWRDELLPAKWCLDYDMKHVYLRPLLEWRMAIDHNWAAPAGSMGKGLKKQLPPALWTQLESCYAGATIADNWVAFYNTMALFGQVAREVGVALGYVYPVELEQRVTAYVQKIQHLAR